MTVETFAGTGMPGSKDGPRAEAQFNSPGGLAVDAAGNVYVFDWYNARVRRITPEGSVSTVAGAGAPGFADGPAAQAKFRGYAGLALDSRGYLYVADGQNHRIRRITPEGMVETFAGTGAPGYRDGPSHEAQFHNPTGVAVDAAGVVYVADNGNNRVRRITPDGRVSTLAGTGAAGYRDGAALEAQLDRPVSVALGPAGEVVVAEAWPPEYRGSRRLRLITPDGRVTSLAGSGWPGHRDGAAGQARFVMPMCASFDAAGDVFVADYGDGRVRMITPDGFVYTVAGTGEPGGADGPGASAEFANPACLAVSPQGAVYVADISGHVIRRITFTQAAMAPMPTQTPPPAATVPTVKIGLAVLFQGFSSSQLNAARLAVQEANASGGLVIAGQAHAVELVVASECCGEEGARYAAQALVEQGVVAAVGHALSEAAMAASPIYTQTGTLHITTSAQDPHFTAAGETTAYRLAPNLTYGTAKSARMVYRQLGIRRAALVIEPYDLQEEMASEWAEAFEALGGAAFRHAVTPENGAALASAIREERAEAVILFRPRLLDLETLLQQLHQAGLSGLPVIGYMIAVVYGDRPPPAFEGLYDLTPGWPTTVMPGFDQFAAAYAAQHFALAPVPDGWAAFTYDATRLVIAAVRQAAAAGTVTRQAVAAAMARYKNEPFEGITGSIQFDDRGDMLEQPVYFRRWVNGQWIDLAPP